MWSKVRKVDATKAQKQKQITENRNKTKHSKKLLDKIYDIISCIDTLLHKNQTGQFRGKAGLGRANPQHIRY